MARMIAQARCHPVDSKRSEVCPGSVDESDRSVYD